MHPYLPHLLLDLRQAAASAPAPYPWRLHHPADDDTEWIAELAATPFRTIAAWTGIPAEALPSHDMLTWEEVVMLVPAMEALWEAYHLEFNVTDPMGPDLKYRMMLHCWDDYVQYLPQSGCDVELCAGNAAKCRMGDDCFCLYIPPYPSFDDLPCQTPSIR